MTYDTVNRNNDLFGRAFSSIAGLVNQVCVTTGRVVSDVAELVEGLLTPGHVQDRMNIILSKNSELAEVNNFLNTRNNELETKVQELTRDNKKLRHENRLLENAESILRTTNEEKSSEIDKLLSEMDESSSRVQELSANVDSLSPMIAHLKSQSSLHSEANSRLRIQLSNLFCLLRKSETSLQTKSGEHEATKQCLATARDTLACTLEEKGHLERAYSILEERSENQISQNDRLSTDNACLTGEIANLRLEITFLKAAAQTLSRKKMRCSSI